MSTVTNFTAEMASAWMICVCSAFNKDANIMERDALTVFTSAYQSPSPKRTPTKSSSVYTPANCAINEVWNQNQELKEAKRLNLCETLSQFTVVW